MTILGIDIGGSGIKGAPVDVKNGTLAGERYRIPTPDPSTPTAVSEVAGRIVQHFGYQGIGGITFPGVVKDNQVFTAANVDVSWIGADADDIFSPVFGGKVAVMNDADAAGMAEVRFGAGRDRKGVIILLTFGTGIGSAVFTDGKLIPNTELGHLKIRGRDAEKRASERVREEKKLTWKRWAKRAVEYLNELETLFSPDLFIIGGGMSKDSAKFLHFLRPKLETEILPASLGNQAGIIGAACIAADLAKASKSAH